MNTTLIKALPLAALLVAASGCELINFDAPIDPPPPGGDLGEGGTPTGPAPLYPFRPGSTWQYTVTALDGSVSRKFVTIGKQAVMVGGNGDHQLDMAYPVRTAPNLDGPASYITMQQSVGSQIVKWREQTFDQWGQQVLEVNWDPQQLEVDQSNERTRPGATWLETYTMLIRPLGGIPSTVRQNESWTVVGHELLALPGIPTPFQTVVYQKSAAAVPPSGDGGASGDAGKSGDAAVPRPPPPTLAPGQTWSEAADSGVMMPKTLWYARGYGKVKEAGGGQPTEELSGLELH
jgi:hypothetical protein